MAGPVEIAQFHGRGHEANAMIAVRFEPRAVAERARDLLAQCEAHTAIVDFCADDPLCHDGGYAYTDRVLWLLAQSYRHRPGYREEWRP